MSHGNVGSKSSDGSGRGRSAASASLLAAKAELLGTLDAMLSEEWEATHLRGGETPPPQSTEPISV